MEYGYTQDQDQMIFMGAISRFPETVVKNMMANPAFMDRVTNHIAGSGGCKALVDLLGQGLSEELEGRGADK